MIATQHHGEFQHVAIFASPRAGTGAGREEIPRLIDRLRHDGVDVCTCESAAELQAWCGQRASLSQTANSVVVAAGGDGTITLAASLMLAAGRPEASDEVSGSGQKDRSPCLLPMPMGTENLLAKHFGHHATAVVVAETIRQGHRTPIDLGMVRRTTPTASHRQPSMAKPMLTMVSCGFDADVVRRVHLKRKGHIRRMSYFRPILQAMRGYRFPELSIELLAEDRSVIEVLKGGWVMVFNLPRYAGGLNIEPDAVGDDGWLDVIVFAGRSWMSGVRYLAGIQSGTHLHHRDVRRVKAQAIRITSNQRVHYQIDGDYVGRLPIEITTCPQAIELLIPSNPISLSR